MHAPVCRPCACVRQRACACACGTLLGGVPPSPRPTLTAPLCCTAGATEGFFLGDSGLTCCHYDCTNANVVLGTDRGQVHFLDAAGLQQPGGPGQPS